MYSRTFIITVSVNDNDRDLVALLPAIIRARFEGTAVRVEEISADLSDSEGSL